MDEPPTSPAPEWEQDSAIAPSSSEGGEREQMRPASSTQDATGEEAEQFGAAMRRMPTDYQAVIELIGLEKKSIDEVSKSLNCSTEAARTLWLNAFALLQVELGFSQPKSDLREPGERGTIPAVNHVTPKSPVDLIESNGAPSTSQDPEPATWKESDASGASGPARECLELIERVRQYRKAPTPQTLLAGIASLLDDSDPQTRVSPHRLGRFEIVRELGRGGHGIVYSARDPSLKRQVALKIPRPDLLLSKSLRRRFVDEARAVARLDHPNVVRVLEAGLDGTFCYIVQELCDGPSLATWLRERPQKIEPDVAAWIAQDLARALAHAHQNAILHRDVKPGNVLLKPRGSATSDSDSGPRAADASSATSDRIGAAFPFTPKLCDFGICKVFDDDEGRTATQTDLVVGTAAYMAPEQATGNTSETGPRTDVYGLGAILYEMLAGVPPIRGNSRVDILRRVVTDEPISIRRIRPNVPRDLELICLKCLEKEPARRYASAEGLAEDLDHFLKGEPISVRSVRPWERAWLWSRRHPLQAASLLGVVLLLCAWLLTVTAANMRLHDLNESLASLNALLLKAADEKDAAAVHAHELQLAAERDRAKADELLYVSDMQQAGTALRSGDMRRLMSLLERHTPRARAATYQGGESDFLRRRGQVAHHLIAQGTQPIYFVCPTPDERFLATAGKDAVIRVYDAASFKPVLSIDTHQVEVNGLAFARDGNTLASAGDDGTIAVWAIDWKKFAARRLLSINAHPSRVYNLLYTQDGRTLVSAGRDTVIRLWDPATGRSTGVLQGHHDTAGSIALHPAGKWLTSAGHEGEVIVWDLASHAIVRRFAASVAPVLSIDFSDDGRLFAASTRDHDIRIWRVPSWELAKKIELLDNAQRVAFLPGGSVLACDSGGTVRTCPTAVDGGSTGSSFPSGGGTRAWQAHRDQIYSLVASRKSQELITAGSDGLVIAWNLHSSTDFKDLRAPFDVEDIQFVPRSNQLALIGRSEFSLWDAESLARKRVLGKAGPWFRCVAASRDGSTVVAGAMGGLIRLYRLNEGDRELEWNLGPNFNVHRIAVSPDGRFVAAIDRYNSEKHDDLYVIDTQSGKRLEHIRAIECNCAAFSPDGRWLFASGLANVVTVWNVQTQAKVSELPGHTNSINCILFHPRSEWVATASDDRLIKVWSTNDWRLKFNLEGARRPLICLATSINGRTLASSEGEGVLTLWHTASEEDLFQPMIDVDFSPAHPERITFSSDGRLVACVLNDPTSKPAGRFVRVMNWGSESPASASSDDHLHRPGSF